MRCAFVGKPNKKVFLVPIQSQDGVTLFSITEECVVPKTHIITDWWKGYVPISKSASNYTHSVVNHSEDFIGNFNLLTPKSKPKPIPKP